MPTMNFFFKELQTKICGQKVLITKLKKKKITMPNEYKRAILINGLP